MVWDDKLFIMQDSGSVISVISLMKNNKRRSFLELSDMYCTVKMLSYRRLGTQMCMQLTFHISELAYLHYRLPRLCVVINTYKISVEWYYIYIANCPFDKMKLFLLYTWTLDCDMILL